MNQPESTRRLRAQMRGVVESIRSERPGYQELAVRVGEDLRPAINYPPITGLAVPGDRVWLNTWAVSLKLGTGGFDFVVAIEGASGERDCPGHILKLRYSPLQFPVLAAEAPESPHYAKIRDFESLDRIPVVCAELHSQLAPIAAAVKWETAGRARVVYVMTDGGALSIALSNLVSDLRDRGLLDATVSAGQAFGGDLEAVNVFSGLGVARAAAGADVIIVSQGPGSAGTATPLGFSGIDQGIALNAAIALGGTAICAPRISFDDPRARHRGLSHHTVTVLGRVVLASVLVPIPRLSFARASKLRSSISAHGLVDKHQFITVDALQGFQAFEQASLNVTTMGRAVAEDRFFFLTSVAAGLLAGQCAADQAGWERRSGEKR